MKRESRIQFLGVSALTVGMDYADQAELDNIFLARGWKLKHAPTREEARSVLESTPVSVVIADSELQDGGWKALIDDLTASPGQALMVVTARLADELLWAEVLNMGGYDVLARPLDGEEVARVMDAAMRHFDNERMRPRARSVRRRATPGGFAKAAEVA